MQIETKSDAVLWWCQLRVRQAQRARASEWYDDEEEAWYWMRAIEMLLEWVSK